MISRRAFTAIEVILVLSLLVIMVSLFLVNIFQFEGRFNLRPASEQLQRAVGAAHWHSRIQQETIFLFFETEERTLNLVSSGGQQLESFPLPKGGSFQIQFFTIMPEEDFGLEPAFEPNERSVEQIPFTINGSPPFLAEIESGMNLLRLRFDSFSGQILSTESEI